MYLLTTITSPVVTYKLRLVYKQIINDNIVKHEINARPREENIYVFFL